VKLQLDEITSGQWFSLPEAIQQVVYPEGKAILKQTKKILETT